jgi:hypothetical protein
MATVTTSYVPQIDYTSRDYAAIRADLVALASQYNPGWTATNEADLGVTLLELFAYLGDNLNFYIDRMANEGFLATASQSQSVLQLAAMLGYTPSNSSAATVTLTFSNTSASSQTVPAKTQIASSAIVNGLSTQIIFETDSAVTVPVGTNSATVAATQGSTTTAESVGNSNGTPSQLFKLAQDKVIVSSVLVYVAGISYSYSQNLIDNSPYDSVFTTVTNADGYTYIVFGDGVGGRIPPSSQAITATYRTGNGVDGNVGANTINKFLTNIISGVTVFNSTAASGGSNSESVDSIRFNAPRALKTLRRAVSLKDYGYLALQVNGVSKAIADSASFTNVTLYATPFGDSGSNTASVGPITAVSGGGTGSIVYSVASTTGLAVGQFVTITGMAPNSLNVNNIAITAVNPGVSFTIASSVAAASTSAFSSTLSASSTAVVKTGNSSAFTAIQTAASTYFTDKVAPNVTLTVSPATYVPIDLEMTVRVLPQYQQSSVFSQVTTAVANLVSLDNSFFADRVPVQFILNAAATVAGVDYSTVELLRFTSNQQIFSASGWYRTSGVVTLNTYAVASGTAHNITVGQRVRVNNIDTSVDSTTPYVVTAVTSTSISFLNGSGTSGSSGSPNTVTSVANYIKVVQVDDITCGTTQIPTKGTFTITASGGTV